MDAPSHTPHIKYTFPWFDITPIHFLTGSDKLPPTSQRNSHSAHRPIPTCQNYLSVVRNYIYPLLEWLYVTINQLKKLSKDAPLHCSRCQIYISVVRNYIKPILEWLCQVTKDQPKDAPWHCSRSQMPNVAFRLSAKLYTRYYRRNSRRTYQNERLHQQFVIPCEEIYVVCFKKQEMMCLCVFSFVSFSAKLEISPQFSLPLGGLCSFIYRRCLAAVIFGNKQTLFFRKFHKKQLTQLFK